MRLQHLKFAMNLQLKPKEIEAFRRHLQALGLSATEAFMYADIRRGRDILDLWIKREGLNVLKKT